MKMQHVEHVRRLLPNLVVFLLVILITFSSTTALATSYDYIIDREGLFDDSSDMVALARDIRGALDFDLHVYSLKTIEEADSIIDEYRQNASALLIFISKDGNMTWWSGTAVKKVIRDVEFEVLFERVVVYQGQYTEPVNFVLRNIVNVFIAHAGETVPPTKKTQSTTPPNSQEENQSWIKSWFNRNILDYIREHPLEILGVLLVVSGIAIYYSRINDKSESKKTEKNNKEKGLW